MAQLLSDSTATIVNVFVILGAVYGALRWLRKWLQREVAAPLAESQEKLADQLRGLGEYAEHTREIAIEANATARVANERLNSMSGG